ncbi:MAG: aminomethyltransferase [Actinomycetota bacterium]|jgi:aminomethyltransferase|nr:aminomethyltransferase [Actinomycetota bacterium]
MARRHTPYFHKFVEAGAELGDRIGFDAAVVFSNVEEEHLATRERVGVYDVYYQGPLDVKGPDAQALLDTVLVRDVARRSRDGGVLYSSLCDEAGGMLDDLTVYRHSSEHFWLIATPSRVETVESWLREQGAGMRAYITNTISGHAYLSLQGPRSRELLSTLTDADLSTSALPYFRFTEAVVAEVPMVVSRTGYSGELGYELYYPRDYAEHVWDAVFSAGAAVDAKPAGLGALRSVRMEKKYPLYGLDVNDTTSPLEANLAWAVDVDKDGYIGRDALRRQRDDGVSRLLVGIEFSDDAFVPTTGDGVSLDGERVGTVTSAEYGWFLRQPLAMAYLPAGNADQKVVVTSSEGATGTGVVREHAFYDPDGTRVKT